MNKTVFRSNSLTSEKIAVIPSGAEFSILQEHKDNIFTWYNVTYQEKTGWITNTSTNIVTNSTTDNTTTTTDATDLLFKNVKSKITLKERQSILQKLGWGLSKDKKSFVSHTDKVQLHPFIPKVFPTDLNMDGKEDLFILYGNTFTSGTTGSNLILFIKNNAGEYQKNLDTPGLLPEALSTVNNNYPDLVVPKPGLEYSVWRWNNNSYTAYKQINVIEFKKLKYTSIFSLSNTYQNTSQNTDINPVEDLVADSTASFYDEVSTKKTGTASVNKVIYQEKSAQSEPLAVLEKHTSFDILLHEKEKNLLWYKIQHKGTTGWIMDGNIDVKNGTAENHSTPIETNTSKIDEALVMKIKKILNNVYPQFKNRMKDIRLLKGEIDGDASTDDILIPWRIDTYNEGYTGPQGNGVFSESFGLYLATHKKGSGSWNINPAILNLKNEKGEAQIAGVSEGQAKIKNGKLYVEQLEMANSDAHCCPSIKKTYIYVFRKNSFVLDDYLNEKVKY